MVCPWVWPSPGLYLSQGLSRGSVGTSRVRLPPTGTVNMALKPPFSSLHYCYEVPGPEASSPVPLPLSMSSLPRSFLPMGIRGWQHRHMSLPTPIMATPLPGDAHTWRRLRLATPTPGVATPKLVNLFTFSPGPLAGRTTRLTLTLVNARGRDGTRLSINIFIKVQNTCRERSKITNIKRVTP